MRTPPRDPPFFFARMQQEQNKSAKDTTMSGKRMRNITRGYHEKDGGEVRGMMTTTAPSRTGEGGRAVSTAEYLSMCGRGLSKIQPSSSST